jgi:signal transduction histidine kinase
MVLFAGSVVLLLLLVYWMTAGFMARQTDETIEIEITALAEQYRRRGLSGLGDLIGERMRVDPDGSAIYLFATPDYKPLAGNLDEWPNLVADDDGWLTFSREDTVAGEVPARARLFVLRDGLHLLVGRDIRDLVRTEAMIRRGLGWGLGLSVALGLLGGLLMSRRINRRIEVINQTSREIMTGDLSQRIPDRGTGDEFDKLSAQLNAMLDRIEELMQGVRHVTDNIAHDLRTPLTRLRTQLETLRADTTTATAKAGVEASIEEADRLLGTFNALLRIARIEAGGGHRKQDRVELDRIAHDAVEMYRALAEEEGVAVETSLQKVTVSGDRDLIFQAVVNLVDNAVKYVLPGGTVSVAVGTAPAGRYVEVRDNGPGIGDEHKDRVTERLYRVDDARGTPGSGLGLSLVAAVAARHRARLEFRDADPGLIARLTWPDHASLA